MSTISLAAAETRAQQIPQQHPKTQSSDINGQPSLVEETPLMVGRRSEKGKSMTKQRISNSLAAAAIMGFFAVHGATAQQTPSLPLPAGATANFVYFATGSYALTPEDQDHIRDVAGMILSTPAVVATIIGKTDTVGSAEFNEHLSQRRAEAVFEVLVYTHKVPSHRVRLHWTGERLPYISTADEQAEAQNRMVAIIVSNDPSPSEADAKRLLKAMSDYLGAQKAVSFDYDVNLELVSTEQQKIGLASSGTVTLNRPDKLHLTRTGGLANIAMVFDGNTLTLLGKNTNSYAQIEAPGTIDQLEDVLRNKYHRPVPGADMLISDPYKELMSEVNDVKDLGSGVIHGVECDHLAFRTKEVDWQIWIAQGARPYPCRYVITSKEVTGWPQYTLDTWGWKTGAEVASDSFKLEIPADAKKLTPDEVPELNDIPGLFTREGAK